MKKRRYISFSLWGDQAIYNVGILKNITLAKEIYPDWQVIVYYDNSVPRDTIVKIKEEGGIVVDMTGVSYGMFWRFFAADLADCECAIFRDADSRLTVREKLAVDRWIKSGKSVHIIRDHPYHEVPYGTDGLSILGGMWGIKGNVVPIRKMVEDFSLSKTLDYGIDQTFLRAIFIRFKKDSFVHDEFFSGARFPIKREDYRFIGERIDENDRPVNNDWEAIKNYKPVKTSLLQKVKHRIKTVFGIVP